MIAPQHFASILQERITLAIKEETDRLAQGMATDWSDYKDRTGQIKGMRNVERIIVELTEDDK